MGENVSSDGDTVSIVDTIVGQMNGR